MFPATIYLSLAVLALILPAAHAFSPGFPYGSKKIRGVNLGGWLLLEVRYHPFNGPNALTFWTAMDNTIHFRQHGRFSHY